MRTIIDIPEQQLIPLDQMAAEEGVSRAEAVRQGIELWLEIRAKKRKKVTLDDAFGMFRHDSPYGDGLEYQLKMRAEWDDRDQMIEEWRKRQKKHPIKVKVLSSLGKKDKKPK